MIFFRPNQSFVSDKINEINHHKSLSIREKSTNRSNPNTSHTQYRIPSDSHHYDHKSVHKYIFLIILIEYYLLQNKSSDQSSSGDCVLTIQHKHKHKRSANHYHRQHNHYTTTSFETLSSGSLSSHNSVPIKESVLKYKQTSVDIIPADTESQQTVNSNLVITNEQIPLFKLLTSSSDNIKHLPSIASFSFQPPEVEIHEYPIVDKLSSNDLNKSNSSSSNNSVYLNTNSLPLEKKTLRINHYPNMLVDFD